MRKAASTAPAVKLTATMGASTFSGELALPDGIYLGLDEARYHADSALGSSNIRDLLKGANLYWWKSWMNPNRPKDKKTESKILGSATHKLLLEGFKAFDAIYVRGPYTDADEHLSGPEKGAMTKEAKKKLLEGQELLKADDYDFVMNCKSVVDSDPELAGCLDNGPSEVSIFWTRSDGVRCKVRLDKLKIGGIGDIKTIANERERDLEEACCLDIKTYRYDIPAEHYSEGRRQMGALLAKGLVFAGTEQLGKVGKDKVKVEGSDGLSKEVSGRDYTVDETKMLQFLGKCAAQKAFGFQFVFIPKSGAPDAWSTVITSHPDNPFTQGAHMDIARAIERYKKAKERFGTGRWLPLKPVEELDLSQMPYGFGKLTAPRG